ncbi:MAG: alpha/beta hydrolase-fold protein [Elusimicrobiota bacterium]
MRRFFTIFRVPYFSAVLFAVPFSGCAVHSARSYRWMHFVSHITSGPQPIAECGGADGMRYCLHTAPREAEEDPTSVLYFLHYAGGSEMSWREIPLSRFYYSYFRRRGLPAPKVVSISYGPDWVLLEEPGEKFPALFNRFIERDMPLVEAKIGEVQRRYIWGMSQGGLNAAELVLKRPELFDGAVLSCPAFYSVSIYAADEELRRYTRRTHADHEGSVMWGIRRLRPHVGGPQAWAREDPLALARENRRVPPLLIQANRRDEFGFYEGAGIFYRELRWRNQPVTFKPHRGGHCVIGIRQAVRFIRRLRW